MNSRDKGKRGERELAKELSKYGHDCRRGQQYCGADGSADVVGVDGLHIECKRVERLRALNEKKDKRIAELERDYAILLHNYKALAEFVRCGK